MSWRSPEPCRHDSTAPHPRGADPGAQWQTLCDFDRRGIAPSELHDATRASLVSAFPIELARGRLRHDCANSDSIWRDGVSWAAHCPPSGRGRFWCEGRLPPPHPSVARRLACVIAQSSDTRSTAVSCRPSWMAVTASSSRAVPLAGNDVGRGRAGPCRHPIGHPAGSGSDFRDKAAPRSALRTPHRKAAARPRQGEFLSVVSEVNRFVWPVPICAR
jgi:hypothetical protein